MAVPGSALIVQDRGTATLAHVAAYEAADSRAVPAFAAYRDHRVVVPEANRMRFGQCDADTPGHAVGILVFDGQRVMRGELGPQGDIGPADGRSRSLVPCVAVSAGVRGTR